MIGKLEDIIDFGLSSLNQYYFLITSLYFFQAISFFTFNFNSNTAYLLYMLFYFANLCTLYLVVCYMKIRFVSVPIKYSFLSSSTNFLFIESTTESNIREGHNIASHKRRSNINFFFKHEIVEKIKLNLKYCKQCGITTPLRVYHCFECNRCYYKLEFHSKVFRSCINYYTLKYYLNFYIVFILRDISLFLAVLFFMNKKNNRFEVVSILILISLELLCALKFAISAVLGVLRDETYLEKNAKKKYLQGNLSEAFIFKTLQNENIVFTSLNRNKSKLDNFLAVYGRNVFRWFNLSFSSEKPDLFLY
ncbi:Palmitoyltransferase PFA3 [Cucumispora dikerogammari]|nr:Palmitoyltransferase PFA3 [Cucumispora dikerogammari]